MKEKEILKVVKEEFKRLHKLTGRVLKDFDMESVHDFRVEIKKLRAFLRLLNFQCRNDLLSITKKMKTFYGYTGIIRNIQLQKRNIIKYVDDHHFNKPQGYLEILNNEEIFWQKQAEELMNENNFYDDEDEILKNLPDKLEKSSIKRFIHSKKSEVKKSLIRLDDDDALHKNRKILKDLLYTWPIIEPYIASEDFVSNEEEIKVLTTMLGSFRDICIGLNFFQPVYFIKIINPQEKILLQQIENDWYLEKAKIKQAILTKMYSFHFPKKEDIHSLAVQ